MRNKGRAQMATLAQAIAIKRGGGAVGIHNRQPTIN
jgi:hypothetical protein